MKKSYWKKRCQKPEFATCRPDYVRCFRQHRIYFFTFQGRYFLTPGVADQGSVQLAAHYSKSTQDIDLHILFPITFSTNTEKNRAFALLNPIESIPAQLRPPIVGGKADTFERCTMQNNSNSKLLSLKKDSNYKRRTKNMTNVTAQRSETFNPETPLNQTPLMLDLAKRALAKTPASSSHPEPLEVLTEVREFSGTDKVTEAFIQDGIPYFVNAFYPENASRGHSQHGIPYRACFSAWLVAFFIALLSRLGSVVYDPFMGRGTTPLQSALMGRRAYGSDINPLSMLLTRPRLDPNITQDGVEHALASIDWSNGDITPDGLDAFFHPGTARQIAALRRYLSRHAPNGANQPDPIADWIRMVVLSGLTGHSSGYLSGRSLPPNQMVSVAGQQRLNLRNGQEPPERDAARIISSKTRSLLRDGCVPSTSTHMLGVGPAYDNPSVPDASVDLVFTSPSFADVVDYGKERWMKLWFAEIDAHDIAFSHIASLNDWTSMIRRTLVEMMLVVKPGGYIAMEVGEIRRGTVQLEKLVWAAAEGLPCRRLAVIVHNGKFTKSSHIYNVENGVLGTNTNRVVILQRE